MGTLMEIILIPSDDLVWESKTVTMAQRDQPTEVRKGGEPELTHVITSLFCIVDVLSCLSLGFETGVVSHECSLCLFL
jgi:hypothetical protein